MIVDFSKYQGAGNDFIMLDNRAQQYNLSQLQVEKLCNRHFGIGADGLILLQTDELSDFEMIYYNSDGNISSMCGNGGRCIVSFAKELGIIDTETQFKAIDGIHKASSINENVALQMIDIKKIKKIENNIYELNTGSPHYVEFTQRVEEMDIVSQAKKIRYSNAYSSEGINVNYVEELSENKLYIRTYERGVEDETLACGTGVTAAAISYAVTHNLENGKVFVKAQGGDLEVKFVRKNNIFTDICLIGNAKKVFSGSIEI